MSAVSSRALAPLAVLALLLPGLALAAEAGPAVLSFRDGVPAQLLSKTLGIAKGFFAISLVIALLVEAFGGSPSQPKNYGGVAWRALLVLALLSGYRVLFGSVVATAQSVADRIAPPGAAGPYEAFGQHNIRAIEALRRQDAAATEPEGEDGWLSSVMPSSRMVKGYVGGALFDGLVLVLVALGQALHWAFTQLTRVLISVLYILGPLALVFHIPAPSDSARRWFRNFVTICTWPIFSAILFAISVSLLMRTDDAAVFGEYSKAFGALATTLLMVVMTLATPMLASATVGGSLKNVPAAALMGAAFALAGGFRAAQGAISGELAQLDKWRGKLSGATDAAPASPADAGAAAVSNPPSSPAEVRGAAAPPDVGAAGGAPVLVGGSRFDVGDAGGPAGASPTAEPAAPGATASQRSGGGGSAVPARQPAAEGLSPALAGALPPNVMVPMAAAEPEIAYGGLEATAVGGKGYAKGAGTFAGAWKLPRPEGLATDDLKMPGADGPAQFREPMVSLPKQFNPADWDDVGS